MADLRDFFEDLVYRSVDRRRFTQQSPVMPDVWIRFAMYPGRQQELIMVPDWRCAPSDLARDIKGRLRAEADFPDAGRYRSGAGSGAAVAHNQSAVVARLWFDQLVRVVLPLSPWWREDVAGIHRPDDGDRVAPLLAPEHRDATTHAMELALAGGESAEWLTPDLLWLARLAGLIAFLSTEEGRKDVPMPDGGPATGSERAEELRAALATIERNPAALAGALVSLLLGVGPVYADREPSLYTVNMNRTGTTALHDSLAAVKADACTRVFHVKGGGVRWAVIDSGIDARHVAFRRRGPDGTPRATPFSVPAHRRRRAGADADAEPERYVNDTRVVATYDFVGVRTLLGTEPDQVDALPRDPEGGFPALEEEVVREKMRTFLEAYNEGMRGPDSGQPGKVIDWQALEPILRVPHTPDRYRAPIHGHGTHVAGILGADWRTKDGEAGLATPREDLQGVCPEIELYDLRVLNTRGEGDEFDIMSAMQFVRWLNSHRDFMAIHGANLSLSIPHDVANYACGRTPVCEEAERLVGNGIVVVTAAGNSGRARYLTPSNKIDDGFRTVSITDPGNADAVITVGSTHRRDAHTYGVSYFSSRGPTGDGRLKPDLVAPGEKIRSTFPGDRDERLDGTSMAAPHVSGAAALLMSRHLELIGQPRRIKDVLCSSATDLGRERYFQGAGLLDALRALQAL